MVQRLLIIWTIFSCVTVHGQDSDWRLFPAENQKKVVKNDSVQKPGSVELIMDARIEKLEQKHVRINKEKGTIEGYRIQIYSGSGVMSKTKAREVRSEFLTKFPDMPAYLIFQTPNFKIRIGDFRDRLSASKCLKAISAEYPNAFIVNGEIQLPELTSR